MYWTIIILNYYEQLILFYDTDSTCPPQDSLTSIVKPKYLPDLSSKYV